MLRIRELRDLAHRVQRNGLATLEISGAGYSVRLSGDPAFRAPLPPVSAEAVTGNVPTPPAPQTITAQMPGHIWLQDPLTGKAIAADTRTVAAGDLLALLQVGPVCLPLRASRGGRAAEYVVAHGERVEYGQPVVNMLTEESADAGD